MVGSIIAIREKWRTLVNKQIVKIQVPLTCGDVTVTNLGKYRTKKHNKSKSIYPIGFQSQRMFPSVENPLRNVMYYSEVLDGGNSGPIFRVWNEEGVDERGSSSDEVWLAVASIVAQKKGEAPPTHVDGIAAFGYMSDPIIQLVCEGIDIAKDDQSRPSFFRAVDTLHSFWHPACIGYKPKAVAESFLESMTKISPIFMGYHWLRCEYCAFCHLPGSQCEELTCRHSRRNFEEVRDPSSG